MQLFPGYELAWFYDEENPNSSHYYIFDSEDNYDHFSFHDVEFLWSLTRGEQREEVRRFGKCLQENDPIAIYHLVRAAKDAGYRESVDGRTEWFARWLYEKICPLIREHEEELKS